MRNIEDITPEQLDAFKMGLIKYRNHKKKYIAILEDPEFKPVLHDITAKELRSMATKRVVEHYEKYISSNFDRLGEFVFADIDTFDHFEQEHARSLYIKQNIDTTPPQVPLQDLKSPPPVKKRRGRPPKKKKYVEPSSDLESLLGSPTATSPKRSKIITLRPIYPKPKEVQVFDGRDIVMHSRNTSEPVSVTEQVSLVKVPLATPSPKDLPTSSFSNSPVSRRSSQDTAPISQDGFPAPQGIAVSPVTKFQPIAAKPVQPVTKQQPSVQPAIQQPSVQPAKQFYAQTNPSKQVLTLSPPKQFVAISPKQPVMKLPSLSQQFDPVLPVEDSSYQPSAQLPTEPRKYKKKIKVELGVPPIQPLDSSQGSNEMALLVDASNRALEKHNRQEKQPLNLDQMSKEELISKVKEYRQQADYYKFMFQAWQNSKDLA